jgi:hypothetical protein
MTNQIMLHMSKTIVERAVVSQFHELALNLGAPPGDLLRRVDDAHPDPHRGRLGGKPRDQGHTVEPFTAGRHGQGQRELLHHAERVLELLAVGRLRYDDPVERPDGVEVEVLGEVGEVLDVRRRHRLFNELPSPSPMPMTTELMR